jgi:uncharacterized membrane protein
MREDVIEPLSSLMEFIGVAIIVIGLIGASIGLVRTLLTRWGLRGTIRQMSDITRWDTLEMDFGPYRRNLLRVIVLGLTFLVAGDIISTASVDRTLNDVGTLALIVAIREFLSVALAMETTGRWPWQDRDASPKAPFESEMPPLEPVEQAPIQREGKGGLFTVIVGSVLVLAALKAFNLN